MFDWVSVIDGQAVALAEQLLIVSSTSRGVSAGP
jgi:hypothetical protein